MSFTSFFAYKRSGLYLTQCNVRSLASRAALHAMPSAAYDGRHAQLLCSTSCKWARQRSRARPSATPGRMHTSRKHTFDSTSASTLVKQHISGFNSASAGPGRRRKSVQRTSCVQQPSTETAKPDSGKWRAHVIFCGGALALASVHRVTLAILGVTFQQEFGLTLPQMGVLQSSMLWGYVLGQLPSGLLADRIGGSPLMTASIVFWCFASGLTPMARSVPRDYLFAYIFFVRALLGLAQSGIVTSTSAMSARWVPSQYRSTAMGFCYFLYSGGVVVSLLATPIIAKPFGWPAAYQLYVALGLVWAAYGFFGMAPEKEATYPIKHPAVAADDSEQRYRMTRQDKFQVAVLIWTHSVIGWGFTLLQNWIPTILAALGMADLQAIGLISALPWAVTWTIPSPFLSVFNSCHVTQAASLVSLCAGLTSDWLHKSHGWSLVNVRKFCQTLATLGPASALTILGVLGPRASVPLAVSLLVTTAGLQAFCYAGFHSYTQDVAAKDAGRLLGMTNTGGTVVGVACNILTGKLAAQSAGFSSVFFIAAIVYFSSFVTWNLFMNGEQVRLS